MRTNKKKNIGIIGAGMIGGVHIDNIHKDGRSQVTWIAARTEKTLKEKLKKHAIENATLDYRDMLQDASLDAVVIAAPPFAHYRMLEDALESGKHVLLEKPAAPNRDELNAAVETVEKHPDLLVLECSCRHARLQPKFEFIKSMIDAGELGEIYYIHHNALSRATFIEYNPAGKWALEKSKAGGGPFIDWGVYDLSFHLGLLDDAPQFKAVKSFTQNGLKVFPDRNLFSDVEEHGGAYLEFDNGLTYYYERGSGVHMEVGNKTRMYGTKGGIQFGFCSWDPPEIEFYHLDKAQNEQHKTLKVDVPEEHDDNFALTKHFLDCLIDNAEPQMTIQLAAKHLDILFRILGEQ